MYVICTLYRWVLRCSCRRGTQSGQFRCVNRPGAPNIPRLLRDKNNTKSWGRIGPYGVSCARFQLNLVGSVLVINCADRLSLHKQKCLDSFNTTKNTKTPDNVSCVRNPENTHLPKCKPASDVRDPQGVGKSSFPCDRLPRLHTINGNQCRGKGLGLAKPEAPRLMAMRPWQATILPFPAPADVVPSQPVSPSHHDQANSSQDGARADRRRCRCVKPHTGTLFDIAEDPSLSLSSSLP